MVEKQMSYRYQKLVAAGVVLLALAVVGAGCSQNQDVTGGDNMQPVINSVQTQNNTGSSGSTDTQTNTNTQTQENNTNTAKPTATMYKDGTYTADGEYGSPAGQESITVSLTLKGDVITDTSAVGHATNFRSSAMQNAFISGYKTLVIGKNIDSVSLDRVSGFSLTPEGFNDAVAKIKAQAKA